MPVPLFVKAELATRIDEIISRSRLTKTQTAALLGLSHPDVSRLLRGDFRDYSIERLLRLLMALGRDVDIVIRNPKSRRRGNSASLQCDLTKLRTEHVWLTAAAHLGCVVRLTAKNWR